MKLTKAWDSLIEFVFIIIIGTLFYMAVISTSIVTAEERVLFVKDSIIRNVIFIIIMLVCANIATKMSKNRIFILLNDNAKSFIIIKSILILLFIVCGLTFVIQSKFVAVADASSIIDYVEMFSHGYIQETFAPGTYMHVFQNQIGLFWLELMISKIVGLNNLTICMQIINVFAGGILIHALDQISEKMGLSNISRIGVILFCLIWFPLLAYTSFAYSNLMGLTIACCSIVFYEKYLQNRKISYLIISLALIAISVIFKQNFLIYLIALIICSVFRVVMEKNKKGIVVPLCYSGCFVAPSIVVFALKKIYNLSFSKGASYLSWIAMGFQESVSAPGWFNGYNVKSFFGAGYSPSVQSWMAIKEIGKCFLKMLFDKQYMIRFFVMKVASSFNEPTFESLYIIHSGNALHSRFADFFDSIPNLGLYVSYTDFLFLFCLLGCMFFALCGNIKYENNLLPTIFIGGAIFHLIWETKPQYAFLYFVILIPVSFKGWESFCLAQKSGEKKNAKIIICSKYVALCLVAAVMLRLSIMGYTQSIQSDNMEFEKYIEDGKSDG